MAGRAVLRTLAGHRRARTGVRRNPEELRTRPVHPRRRYHLGTGRVPTTPTTATRTGSPARRAAATPGGHQEPRRPHDAMARRAPRPQPRRQVASHARRSWMSSSLTRPDLRAQGSETRECGDAGHRMNCSTACAKPSSSLLVVTRLAARWTSWLALPIAMDNPEWANISTSLGMSPIVAICSG